eukprot:299332-Pyramimonas_sp.AAC.1
MKRRTAAVVTGRFSAHVQNKRARRSQQRYSALPSTRYCSVRSASVRSVSTHTIVTERCE